MAVDDLVTGRSRQTWLAGFRSSTGYSRRHHRGSFVVIAHLGQDGLSASNVRFGGH
jgi:hypothetical protein